MISIRAGSGDAYRPLAAEITGTSRRSSTALALAGANAWSKRRLRMTRAGQATII
jgi:hypothetical protein